MLPFSELSKEDLHSTIQGKKIKFISYSKKHSENEILLLAKISDAHNENDLSNSPQYLYTKKFNKTFTPNKYQGTNLFHMNISSLFYNFEQFHALLSELDINYDIIGITETRLKRDILRTTNIDLKGYSFEHTPTEASCGGILLYLKNNINYTLRNDLKI